MGEWKTMHLGRIVSMKNRTHIESEKCWKKFFSSGSVPNNVWLIALWGLFMGITTTMIYSQLSMFLKHELHASTLKIALLDGFVELLSNLTRIFAGTISDVIMNRKSVLVFGCVFSVLIKPLFVMAHSVYTVLIAQSLDRISNGIQASPRDALVADVSDARTISSSYGLTRSLKTVGAFIGTLCAITLLGYFGISYRTMFAFAFIPAVVSILILLKVKEPLHKKEKSKFSNPFTKDNVKSLNWDFWKIIVFAFLFEMAHFSDALLVVRANDFLDPVASSIATVTMNVGQLACAYPIGILADRYGKGVMIQICVLLMLIANALLLVAWSGVPVFIGAFCWGGQMASAVGLFLSLIREVVSEKLRGTAIGIYYTVVGFGYFSASLLAGKLWNSYGCEFAFGSSVVICVICLSVFNLMFKQKA